MYIVARNAHKRPMLMHRLMDDDLDYTSCGVWVGGWSRFHMQEPIPVLLCLKCKKIEEA